MQTKVVALDAYPSPGTRVQITTTRNRRTLIHKGVFQKVGKLNLGYMRTERDWVVVERKIGRGPKARTVQMAIPAENVISVKKMGRVNG